jgi:outer membrane protein assembly factor BamE (lipoprotein component of BamABCDE complex)
MKKGFAAAIAAIVLAGCATTGRSKVVDQEVLSTLKPGVTTITQVETDLGQPFQDTKEPDGTEQLQYISKVRKMDPNARTVGSNIPRQIEENVSALLVFDQSGRFLHAWTSDKTVDENVPGNMGKMQQGDVTRGSLFSRGI